jgi:hypothetical protein
LANTIINFENLYRAFKKTLRGKRENPTALKYSLDASLRLATLKRKLEIKDYKVGNYYAFNVYEPKKREILALNFEDKIVQHSLCDQVLYPAVTKSFILDNYASQKGKGTHFGLDRLTKHLRHYYFSRKAKGAGNPHHGFILKGDFKKFFYSLSHEVLTCKVRKSLQSVSDEELKEFSIWLLELFIASTDDPGVPLGNQSSQLFALLYIDEIDHLVKDELGFKFYGRYMDDFYIIAETKEELYRVLKRIEDVCVKLKVSLNNKTQIFPLHQGIDFLGFHTYLTASGKVVRKLRLRSKRTMKRKLRKFKKMYDAGEKDLPSIIASYESWFAHAEHGDTYLLRKKMSELFLSLFPEAKGGLVLDRRRQVKRRKAENKIKRKEQELARENDKKTYRYYMKTLADADTSD